MADLKTNYVDDVLDSGKNQFRKYQMIYNDDGTVSFVDVTTYTQNGDSFGAKDINDTNAAVNKLNLNLANFFKVKPYSVDTTIKANSSYNVPITGISGYVPIACFYFSDTGENVVYPTCPKQRVTDATFYVALINTYEQPIPTRGNLFVYYIRQI